MAARETKPNGKSQLIRDLKNGEFATLYIISGEESYMKEYYLRQLRRRWWTRPLRISILLSLKARA
ncbi:MAG: hypothetical protein ACLSGI_08630 [Butyricicoccaceae bacterium]